MLPFHQLRACRDNQYPWFCPDFDSEYTGSQQRTKAIRRDLVITGKKQFSGHDIFTDLAHMLPGEGGRTYLYLIRADLVHILYFYDRVAISRQHLAGVHRSGVARAHPGFRPTTEWRHGARCCSMSSSSCAPAT